MFWKQKHQKDRPNMDPTYASEIVSKVGEIFARLNDQGQLIKPRSALPCSWFAVRECFMMAYEAEYPQLPDDLKNAYDRVYGELAFFVEDNLYTDFNASLDIAAKCRSQKLQNKGMPENVAFLRRFLASSVVKIQDRKAIWERLDREDTCPRHDLLLLAETLTCCGELHRALSGEWSAFANLVNYRNK